MEERQACLRKNNFAVVCGMPPNMISETSILQTDSTGLAMYSLSLVIVRFTQLAKKQLLTSLRSKDPL